MQRKKLAPFLFFAPVVTLIIVLSYDWLPHKVFDLNTQAKRVYINSDKLNDPENAKSEAIWLDKNTGSWLCELREGFSYPYCGMNFTLTKDPNKGVDLSIYQYIELDIAYRGPGDKVRIHIRNANPAYSVSGTEDHHKFHSVMLPTRSLGTTLVSELTNFSVADWWIQNFDIPIHLSHPELTNVTSIGIDIPYPQPFGNHYLTVKGLTLKGERVSRASWYLGILFCWIAALLGIGVYWLNNQLRRAQKNAQLVAELAAYNEQLRQLPKDEKSQNQHTDPLTGLSDRFLFTKSVDELLDCLSYDSPASLILISINSFNRIVRSDKDLADTIIVNSAKIINSHARRRFTIARWEDGEFLILCPNLMGASAYQVAEKIRREFVNNEGYGNIKSVSISSTVLEMQPDMSFANHLSKINDATETAKEMGITTTFLAG